MPFGLHRYQHCGDLHFITFSCYRRLPYLGGAETRCLFELALERIRNRYRFAVIGYIVMPEHVHLLVNEPACSSLDRVIKSIKLSVALRRPQRPFWQARYLRLQCMDKQEAGGEAALHAPQSGGARTGREAGGLGLVQLPPLRDRNRWNGGNRVVLDRLATRTWASPSQVPKTGPGAPNATF
jgi:REP element-mobilizing transposase RayT